MSYHQNIPLPVEFFIMQEKLGNVIWPEEPKHNEEGVWCWCGPDLEEQFDGTVLVIHKENRC